MAEARIQLSVFSRHVLDDLPPVCAVCGEQAALFNRHRFFWFSGRSCFLRPLTPWLFLVPLSSVADYQDAKVPLCEDHQNHWFCRNLVVVLSFLGAFVLPCITLSIVQDVFLTRASDRSLAPLGFVILITLALGPILGGLWYGSTAIRATLISRHEIILTNVSPTFAKLIEEEYADAPPHDHQALEPATAVSPLRNS
jgi:hypothetical protein